MSQPVITIENLSKIYRLGEVGTGTLSHDLNRWWRMSVLGQEDPYAKVWAKRKSQLSLSRVRFWPVL